MAGTSTSNFGVGKREGHNATAFYERFVPPILSDAEDVAVPAAVDTIWHGDARAMDEVGTIADNSVALVVTSPPYFAGKAYEEALGEGGIPNDYAEYLQMLRDVFAECVRKLEPGGRIAVNVANLGRKPYRSLSSDIIVIFEELGLLLRGEIIWQKGKGAGGSCAWGSFQRPGNPVLRDVTERIIVASKGRFDRAVDARRRATEGRPHEGSITVDDFLESTLDVWEFAPESAKRVNHPAPYPVELPLRLINLYTYAGDLVLDPFMGVGSTAIAAQRSGRHYIGFDTDADYIARAQARLTDDAAAGGTGADVVVPPKATKPDGETVAELLRNGRKATQVAARLLADAGFTAITDTPAVRKLGVDADFGAVGADGRPWAVFVAGSLTPSPTGLRRSDVLWRTIGQASVIAAASDDVGVLVLTTELPLRATAQAKALHAVLGRSIDAAVLLTAPDAAATLTALHQ